MNGDDSFERYLCLSVDVQGYGRGNDREQAAAQEELLGLLDAAARAAGLARESWIRQGSGDGELALIPAGQSEPAVVDSFVHELAGLLYRRNCDRAPADRLRLRLAIDHGPVKPASNGYASQTVVSVSRLVNAAVVKQALAAAADASLVVVLSQQLYTDVVMGGHTKLQPDLFRRVRAREKEFEAYAWLRVPGFDVHQLALTPDPKPSHSGPGAPSGDVPGAKEGQATPRVSADHSYVAVGDGNVVGTGNVVQR